MMFRNFIILMLLMSSSCIRVSNVEDPTAQDPAPADPPADPMAVVREGLVGSWSNGCIFEGAEAGGDGNTDCTWSSETHEYRSDGTFSVRNFRYMLQHQTNGIDCTTVANPCVVPNGDIQIGFHGSYEVPQAYEGSSTVYNINFLFSSPTFTLDRADLVPLFNSFCLMGYGNTAPGPCPGGTSFTGANPDDPAKAWVLNADRDVSGRTFTLQGLTFVSSGSPYYTVFEANSATQMNFMWGPTFPADGMVEAGRVTPVTGSPKTLIKIPGTPVEASAAIVGSWLSPCEKCKDEVDGADRKCEWQINDQQYGADGSVTTVTTLYQYKALGNIAYKCDVTPTPCAAGNALMRFSHIGTITLPDAVAGSTGVFKANYTFNEVRLGVLNAGVIAGLNFLNAGGYNDWALGVEKDVTGRTLIPGITFISAGNPFYTLVRFSNNNQLAFHMGPSMPSDGMVEAGRLSTSAVATLLNRQ